MAMSEHTLMSIKELQNQMTEKIDDKDKDGDDTSTEVDSDKAENAILKAFSASNMATTSSSMFSSKKQKSDGNGNLDTILTSLLAQHELDRSRISTLTKKLYKLENESEKDELKTHYLRLEFNNTTLALEETKKELKEFKPYKNYYQLSNIFLILYSVLTLICGLFAVKNTYF
jgi:hypothetical protein